MGFLTAIFLMAVISDAVLGVSFIPTISPTKGPTILCSGEHEIWSECGNNSCLKDCKSIALTNVACRPTCNSGCICAPGYLRNANGKCVTPENCDISVCKANEDFDPCYNPCPPETCSDIGQVFKCTVPQECNPTCKCKRNFKRDRNGECIDIRKCPQVIECHKYEIYDPCPEYCIDERCNKDIALSCSLSKIPFPICAPRCRCMAGYCRDDSGNCVPCNGDIYADPTNGCKCKKGYAKDPKGKCSELIRNPCGPNEIGPVCPRCADITCPMVFAGRENDCLPPPRCPPFECPCVKGYIRNEQNQCVLPEKCCKDPNAELVTCPSNCPGGTCQSPKVSVCAAPCARKGCQCKKGYVKRSATDPTCVPLRSCPVIREPVALPS